MEADAPLPDDVPTLQAMARDLQANVLEQAAHFQKRIDDLQAEVASLQTQLATAKKDRFGRKSERTKRTPKPEKPSKPKH
jgi:DNA-binding protein H-NS